MRSIPVIDVTALRTGSPQAPRVAAALHVMIVATVASCAPTTHSTIELRTAPVVAAPTILPRSAEPTKAFLGLLALETRVANEPEPEPARARVDSFEMTFVGDVIFGRYRADGFDPIAEEGLEVFSEVTELLRSHLAIGNLETPLVRVLPERSPIVSPARFGASAQRAELLVGAGFHAMSVANNHAYDLRRAGIEQTPEILAELGIVALGSAPPEPPAVRVQTIEREGWRVGVLAVATRLNGPKPRGLPAIPLVPTLDFDARLVPLVKQARASHHVVVVLVHWGEEYRDTPTRAQRWAAHALVDAGADVVVGHHSHVLQGIERYGAGVIAYSLGNFLFDNAEKIQRETGVLRVRVRARGHDRGCLDAVVFDPGTATEQRLRRLSKAWGTHWVEQGDALVLDMPGCAPWRS